MHISTSTRQKPRPCYFVVSTLFLLLFVIAPLSAAEQDTNSIATLRRMGKAFADIAGKASPAVVGITANRVVTREYSTMPDSPFDDFSNPFDDDFFDRFFQRRFRQPRSPQRKSYRPVQGSGFIVSSQGHILTNNHVVRDTEQISVKLADGRDFKAKVVGTDPDTDVAVIKIDSEKDLPYLELADSDALEVGEWVLAIGNPFGLNHTVTAGIVSAKGRSGIRFPDRAPEYQDFIQTDAAINPGNSGGPLIDLNGEVVGINTFIITAGYGHGGNIGIGFAIPVNMAKAVYGQLVESGKVVRGFLGVGIQDLTAEFAKAFGLDEDAKGVLIPNVQEGSAAEKSGIKHNDIIVEFEGEPVESAKDLQSRVAVLKPGTKVTVAVLRDGKRKYFTVKLGERPGRSEIAGKPPQILQRLGLTVQELTDDVAEHFGYQGLKGVVVTRVEPDSEAARKGITRGMLIMEVNRRRVADVEEFNKAIEQSAKQEAEAILLLIKQGLNPPLYVVLNLSGD